MAINIFGEEYISSHEYAKMIIREGYKKPFLKLVYYPENADFYYAKLFDILDDKGKPVVLSDCGGMYAIYRKIGNKLECLYAGQSYTNIRRRLFRYMTELADVKDTGGHSGARKARENGVKPTDELLVKVLTNREIAKIYR